MSTEPLPPPASRQDALGRLRTERWHASNNGEDARVAELDAELARLSAHNTAASPQRETAAAAPAAHEPAVPGPVRRTTTRRNK